MGDGSPSGVSLRHGLRTAGSGKLGEKRSTRSWEDAVEASLDSIAVTNKRRSSGGCYLDDEALALTEAWPRALRRASREVFEGIYAAEHLATRVDRQALLETALRQIKERQGPIA